MLERSPGMCILTPEIINVHPEVARHISEIV